ncbi:hypothetical protein B0H14DRAFT_3865204 [Mycena olivaceomarginata]|nr:hypothetical protein B0H14DRAFT_3865204 [Mycena olivaceomarginata]
MSSRTTTPPDDEEMRAISAAMAQESLTVSSAINSSKRSHGTMQGDDDSTSDSEELLAQDPPLLRELKVVATLLAVSNELSKLVPSKPAFETNLFKYAPAVLLSSKTKIYKGNAVTDILLAIVKKFRFDVTVAAQYTLTQRRSKIKKAIRSSLKPNDKGVYGPAAEHQNIYDLAQAVVKDTQCTINVVLCARIALMRQVYLKHPDGDFWDQLDDRLDGIRNEAENDAKKLTRGFRHVLTQDQDKHGAKDYVLDETTVDDVQQQVDDIIAVDTATSTASVQDSTVTVLFFLAFPAIRAIVLAQDHWTSELVGRAHLCAEVVIVAYLFDLAYRKVTPLLWTHHTVALDTCLFALIFTTPDAPGAARLWLSLPMVFFGVGVSLTDLGGDVAVLLFYLAPQSRSSARRIRMCARYLMAGRAIQWALVLAFVGRGEWQQLGLGAGPTAMVGVVLLGWGAAEVEEIHTTLGLSRKLRLTALDGVETSSVKS